MNPSYRIVFYVSGHGFGHTSRTIEVIHAVLRACPEAHIVVKTSAPHRLFARTPRRDGCELVELQCDRGHGADRQPERSTPPKASGGRSSSRRACRPSPRQRRRTCAKAARRWSSATFLRSRSQRPTRQAFPRSRSAISRGIGFTKAIATRPLPSSRATSGGSIRRRPSRFDCRWPAASKGSNR